MMLEVKDIKKKFIRIDEKRKKHEFYADNGITFQAKEGQIIGYDDETSIIHGTVDPITYWTGEKMQTQKVLFGTLVSK